MKGLLKIIRRYSLTTGMIILILLALNAAVFAAIAWLTVCDTKETVYGRESMEKIGRELSAGEEGVTLSEKGEELLAGTAFIWAMALDGKGRVVWEHGLPEEIPRSYTLQDVSAFSRWYLKDYPVRTWKSGELLLVFGCDKEELARYDMLMSVKMFEFLPAYVKTAVAANILIILALIFCFGFRFYHSLKPVAEGIEKLSLGEATGLPETGSMEELAKKLNAVSGRLKEQQERLARRDEARTEWIAGVSHDIRTPLSLIVGYGDKLAEDTSLSEENRRMAEAMKRQCLIIRQLIADLNLTSRLSYEAQPLKKKVCSPAALLRDCAAEVYNGGPERLSEGEDEEDFSIEIIVKEEAESLKITADEGLLKRALRNLIGNSIRHNEKGCQVTVTLYKDRSKVCWRVEDTGRGIPETVVRNMDRQESPVHIMGLRLAAQIARAHGGGLTFLERGDGYYDAEISAEISEPFS